MNKQKQPTVLLWEGRELKELSKKELIDALTWTTGEIERMWKERDSLGDEYYELLVNKAISEDKKRTKLPKWHDYIVAVTKQGLTKHLSTILTIAILALCLAALVWLVKTGDWSQFNCGR